VLPRETGSGGSALTRLRRRLLGLGGGSDAIFKSPWGLLWNFSWTRVLLLLWTTPRGLVGGSATEPRLAKVVDAAGGTTAVALIKSARRRAVWSRVVVVVVLVVNVAVAVNDAIVDKRVLRRPGFPVFSLSRVLLGCDGGATTRF
jgi:hypothetical protein